MEQSLEVTNKPRNQEVSKFDTLRSMLERSKDKLAEVLPKHLTAERLVRIAVSATKRDPKLLQCSQASILSAVMNAAQIGLEPNGALGTAYLVPYGTECQLIVGYRGLIDLARRSGQIISIEAHTVKKQDKFTCRYGLNAALEHEPDWSDNPGEMIAAYAIARLKDGGVQFEVMTKSQIDAIRARSRSGKSGPWATDYDEMARKTVLRRLSKYLPLSVEMATALEIEDRSERGEPAIDIIDFSVQPEKSKTESIKEKLARKIEDAQEIHETTVEEVMEPGTLG